MHYSNYIIDLLSQIYRLIAIATFMNLLDGLMLKISLLFYGLLWLQYGLRLNTCSTLAHRVWAWYQLCNLRLWISMDAWLFLKIHWILLYTLFNTKSDTHLLRHVLIRNIIVSTLILFIRTFAHIMFILRNYYY